MSAPGETVSVVVVSHDYGAHLDEALGSVVNQTRLPDEVVIVDDASIDDTLDVAGRWVSRLPNARLVAIAESRGPAGAFNAGLAAATGTLLVKLDADDRLSDPYLELHAEALAATGADIAYAGVRYFGAESRWIAARPFDRRELMRENFINGSAMIRRRVWEATGGFRAELDHLGFEDWELFVHAVSLGMEAVPVDDCHLEYRRHPAGSRNSLSRLGSLRSHLAVHRMHPDAVAVRDVAAWMGRSLSRNLAGSGSTG